MSMKTVDIENLVIGSVYADSIHKETAVLLRFVGEEITSTGGANLVFEYVSGPKVYAQTSDGLFRFAKTQNYPILYEED